MLESGAVPDLPVDDASSGMADAMLSLAGALDAQRERAGADPRETGLVSRTDQWRGGAAHCRGQPEPGQCRRGGPGTGDRAGGLGLCLGRPAGCRTGLGGARAGGRGVGEARRDGGRAPGADRGARGQRRHPPAARAVRSSERAYDRALERVPEIQVGHWPLLYARGITRERTDRWPEAEADLLSALEVEPDQPLVLNYLGYSWVDQG